jgi:3-hydroxy-3-methylglutaryl CoA synthase
MADLNFVVAHTPRTRNKAVAIRKLIRQEAKRIRQELKENANVG